MLAAISFPILERIPLFGDAAVSPHGIGIAVGFLLGAKLMLPRAEKRGLGHRYVDNVSESVQELLVRAAIGAIIGARLFFVLTHTDIYADDPLSAFRLWEGGLTFLGGLFGAVVAAYPVMIRRGYRPLQVLDSAAPGIALGLVIGRAGDLLIGDHIGNPAGNFPLGWTCSGNYWDRATNGFAYNAPSSYPLEAVTSGAIEPPVQGCYDIALHQTALYDFGTAAILLLLMVWLERKPRWDGFFVAVYVYGYGLTRFLTDFAREDRRWFGLTGSQWALVTAYTVLTGYLVTRKPWTKRPWAWNPEEPDLPWLTPPGGEEADPPASPGTDEDDGAGVLTTAGQTEPDAEERPDPA